MECMAHPLPCEGDASAMGEYFAIHGCGAKGTYSKGEGEEKAGSTMSREERGQSYVRLVSACRKGDISVFCSLLDAGVPVHRPAESAKSCLVMAAATGRSDMLRLLLHRGADPNETCRGDSSIFRIACSGNLALCKRLVAAGANLNIPNAKGTTPLIAACAAGRLEVVKFLLCKGADVTAVDDHGRTCLHAAAYSTEAGVAELCSVLLEYGADVDAVSENGVTPLMITAMRSCMAASRVLLCAGGSLSQKDESGCTPLMHAAAACSPDVCSLFIAAGADQSQTDDVGRPWLMYVPRPLFRGFKASLRL
eukprot:TRINITY_DN32257_c0_g1_i1.p1 TRINITY_DN32257_c0_g1~~TRINITY_DN32257_c0_g1_i1.p1  ORF type:complete len:308 (+),score=98.38 TRINITY_DN32257_c0_g1_i1:63-986(+)